ncbi:MAG: tRNA epoxyqueuosine(34) reductase QueG [Sphingomonadales bacterium]|nr:tRNA epoxyqueuosine(34) reductase QueG [Sphingomonadales bacterium]
MVNALKEKAEAEGFAAIGIALAQLAPAVGDRLRQWVSDGCHGDMLWMEDRIDQRASPGGLWTEVRSVIMLGTSYAPEEGLLEAAGTPDKARLSIYAQRKDYHDVVKGALKRVAQWLVHEAGGEVKVFVDTAPVMEKALAEAAGLGWQGKHTNLVSRDHGSWLLLGAIYTTLDLTLEAPGSDRCGSCNACQTACPTKAFPAPYQLDARRCISYLTIEHKGPIPYEFRKAIGNHVYGCDDCLAACPWNKFASAAAANKAMLPRVELAAPDLADLLTLNDAAFRTFFSGTPIKRTGRDRFVRNLLIAAGNSGDLTLLPIVSELLDDPSPLVRGAAIWALAELNPAVFKSQLANRQATELDESVRDEWFSAASAH